jgi:hypothetical protein
MQTQRLNSKGKRVKQPFTPYEDQIIIAFVNQYGPSDFSQIPKVLPQRTVRQCRERWRLYLNPTVIKSEFTTEEDNTLKQKYIELNGKWCQITKYLPGRTDVQLKFRFSILERRGETKCIPKFQNSNINFSQNLKANETILIPVEVSKERQTASENILEDESFSFEGLDEFESLFDNVDFFHDNSEQPWEFGIFPSNLW